MPRANIIFLILFIMLSATATSSAQEKATAGTKDLNAMMAAFINTPEYRECIELFKEVYRTMRNNYYYSVEVTGFQKFMGVFNAKLYPDFKLAGSSQKFIKWRSAAYLVEALRAPEDIFSAFYPPSEAKQYATEALGQRLDLGIEGKLNPEGFLVTWIEIRSEAYEKGMRKDDIIYKVDEKDLRPLTQKEAVELLNPMEGNKVKLTYLDSVNKTEKTMEVVSKTFFKQAVFLVPTDVPGVFCINLPHFNQATAEDVTRLMDEILSKDGKSIIIDLRGNPGGPPLAARELSAFFLTPHEEFAYFQKRERPKASIDVPEIPEGYRFKGDVVILVDKKSGSASELFAGILQRRKRALIMGNNTAGQVFLKSMFNLTDGSMVLLVTGRGFHPDGMVFSFDGVVPDEKITDETMDLRKYAAEYLAKKNGF